MSITTKIFHSLAVAHFAFGIYYDVKFVLPFEILLRGYTFGSKFVYLTFLNFIIQGVYFVIALLNDFIGSNKSTLGDRPLIRRIRDYIFSSLAFPLAFNVGGIFWVLYSINRELAFPKTLDLFFPWWLNHFVHTNILFFAIFEMILLHHKYPTRKCGLGGLSLFMIGYLAWVHVIKYKTGVWVYPVLDVLNGPQKLGFYLFVAAVPIMFYSLGSFLNSLIWNKTRINETKKTKKTK